MPRIVQLAPQVVNQIAAGEVIERPASVVKELVENAIDAQATRIDVAVEQGGLALLRVSDNGHGIEADDLPLAIASHATSKIRSADDLFRVQTLGFRGEALASIAAISRLLIRTRTAGAAAGLQLEAHGGHSGAIEPCGAPVGTTVELRDLFFNTPVRRKFQRSTQTELGHVSEALTRLALAYPALHFTLRHNDRLLFDAPPTDTWRARIGLFFEAELARDLIDVESEDGPVQLAGLVAAPSHSRSHPRMQYLFLNGRSIRDRSLQHALGEAYRGLLLTGRYPIAFLRFSMPPDWVDVNVHPTKAEVRFQDSGRLYSQLLGTLRTRFLTTDLTSRVGEPGAAEAGEAAGAHDPQHAARLRQNLVDWAKGQLATATAGRAESGALPSSPLDASGPVGLHPAYRQAAIDLPHERLPRQPLVLHRLPPSLVPTLPPAAADAREFEPTETDAAMDLGAADAWPDALSPAATAASVAVTSDGLPAMQVHDRYLITASDDGVLVIDQHALHERILYEALRAKVLAGALESQSLLVPEPVDLTPAEAAAVFEAQEVLAQLGVAIEPFGGDTILVSSYPAMLANLNPGQIVREFIDQLLAGGKTPDRRDLLDALLHGIACKAAIKAGDRLSQAEIAALLEQRHLAENAHHCPHGRPTALVFTRAELDRKFMRT